MTYDEIKSIQVDTEDAISTVKEITIAEGKTIKVLQYLPVEEKYKVLMSTLLQSMDDMISVNPFNLNIFFHINVVNAYTDIVFSEEETFTEAYDSLTTKGILKQIIDAIPEGELAYLAQMLDEIVKTYLADTRSILGSIRAITGALGQFIPEDMTAQDVIDTIKGIDLSDLTNLQDIVSTLKTENEKEQ